MGPEEPSEASWTFLWHPDARFTAHLESLLVRSWEHEVSLLAGVERLEGPVRLERYPSPVFKGCEVLVMSGPVVYWEGGDQCAAFGVADIASATRWTGRCRGC